MADDPTTTAASESWDDVPIRDCYTKVQGQPCGPEHGWASWLETFYRCTGSRTPGVAVSALDGDGRGVAAPTPPSPPVDTAACNCDASADPPTGHRPWCGTEPTTAATWRGRR